MMEEKISLSFQSPPPVQPISEWVLQDSDPLKEISLQELIESYQTTDIQQILLYPGILAQFREKSPILQEWLLNEEIIHKIIDILLTSNDRILLMTIYQLFTSTSNSSLLQFLSELPANIDRISYIFSQNENICSFSIGIATQILITAVKNWSSDVLSMLSNSKYCFFYILNGLQIDSIFQMVIQISQIPPAWFHTYLWGFLYAYVNERVKMPQPPRGWNIDSDGIVQCNHVNLSQVHRCRILKIFSTYFKAFPIDNDFACIVEDVFSFIVSTSFDNNHRIELLELGLYLKPNTKLIGLALDIIDDRAMNSELFHNAIKYLSKYYNDMGRIEPIVNMLFRALNPENMASHCNRPNSIIFNAIVEMVNVMMEKTTYPRFFAKVAQHCVATSWNNIDLRRNMNIRSTLLAVSAVVGDLPSWDGWSAFQQDVVDTFVRKSGAVNIEKVIDIKGWDEQLVEKLRTHSSTIEMSPIDQRPALADILSESESGLDSRSAESGSYIVDISDCIYSDYDNNESGGNDDIDEDPNVNNSENVGLGRTMSSSELYAVPHVKRKRRSLSLIETSEPIRNNDSLKKKPKKDEKKCCVC